jgi:O-antigen/teichoic acid export membrane protein
MDTRTQTSPMGLLARLKASFSGSHETSATNRAALTVLLVRVFSAGLAYVSQIVLARWMGTTDYGIYVYVWTWVLMLGCILDFGLSPTSQKIIPTYHASGEMDLLRGYQAGGRALAVLACTVICLGLAGLVWLLSDRIDSHMVMPLYFGLLTLPAFVAANIQDGIARAYDWMKLALMPAFIIRQVLIIGAAGCVALFGLMISATDAMLISAAAVWVAMVCQYVPLKIRLGRIIPRGPWRLDVRGWLATSIPMVLVEGFYLLLSYTDVLLLQQFRPSDEVGVYYAVVKTLILVSFIHYAIAASSAHRFTELHAAGDKNRLADYLTHAIRLTFWPSLIAICALLALGKPILSLFGPQFAEGYGLMFVMAIGLIVRSAVGPIERFLNMAGKQNLCAMAYAAAFVVNAGLCLVLIPKFGSYGAAASISIALVFLTVLLFVITSREFGIRVSPFRRVSKA